MATNPEISDSKRTEMSKSIGPVPAKPANVEALILNAILESAAAGILSINANGTVRTVNAAALKMFGYESNEIVAHNVSKLMHDHDRRHHDDYIARYLATGESRIVGIGREVTGRRKDGSLFPLHLSVGEFEVDGENFFTGVLIDLSKQKEAERHLAHQQALFRAIYECLPDPVVVTDPRNLIQKLNPAFTRVFELDRVAMRGQTAERIFAHHQDWQSDCERNSGHCSDDAALPERVIEFRRANGETFPAAVVSTTIETEDKHMLGHLSVIRDISIERRREAQLMQAQRMEAIGQLTGGIAHDFNNILTVVLGNVELLEMRLGDDEITASLAREAREAAEIGARLTDRLLTFGRRQMLETRRINLNEFVLGLMELLRRAIGEDIDISTALAADLALTEVDPGEVENALLNLAINARDAMPRGGRLIVETRNVNVDQAMSASVPELSSGDYAVLSVSDTGHGMPPEVKSRAFEPFFTTKGGGTGRGTGLGLATIYGFVKQSGGHATISSEPGAGTTVELFLPASAAPESAVAIERKPNAIPDGSGQHILVVEDNDSVRRLTCRRLEDLGYKVTEAANAVAALEHLAMNCGVELVFSDVVMPGGLSGVDLAREIARHFPAIKVVLTTGYADEMVERGERLDPMPRLIRKPYSQSNLARTMADVFKSAPPGRGGN